MSEHFDEETGLVLLILADQRDEDPNPDNREDSSTPKPKYKGETLVDPTLIKEEEGTDGQDLDFETENYLHEDNCNSVWNNQDKEFAGAEKVNLHVESPKLTEKNKSERKERITTHLCEECGKELKSSASKRRHIEVVHRQNPAFLDSNQKIKDYVCPFCGLELHETPAKFFQHKQTCEAERTGVYRHVCSICGQSFPTTAKHASHYTICSGKAKKYYKSKSCSYEECDFKTSSNRDLDNHVRRVHLHLPIEKNHVCTICGNTFNKITVLKNHIKAVHYGEKPFECTTCGKSFSRKQNLKEHMLIHTGEAGWTCPLCNKSMTNAGSKYNHKRSCTGIASICSSSAS